MRGYWELVSSARFVTLVLVSVLPFNGFFLYVLSSPEWLGTHLGLAPTQFFIYFVLSIGGVMAGAWVCGRLAGRVAVAEERARLVLGVGRAGRRVGGEIGGHRVPLGE